MDRWIKIVVGAVALGMLVALVARGWQGWSERSLGKVMAQEFPGRVAFGRAGEGIVVRFLEPPAGGLDAARQRIAELLREHDFDSGAELDVDVCPQPGDEATPPMVENWCSQLRED